MIIIPDNKKIASLCPRIVYACAIERWRSQIQMGGTARAAPGRSWLNVSSCGYRCVRALRAASCRLSFVGYQLCWMSMGAFQRICTLEALCVGGVVGFFLGTFIGYFAMFYNGCAAGHGGARNCHTIRALLHSDASTGGDAEGIDMIMYTHQCMGAELYISLKVLHVLIQS